MNYLRFSPAEYRALARACRPLPLSDLRLGDFQIILALMLIDRSPGLARRIRMLAVGEIRLLRRALRAEAEGDGRPAFTPPEWRALAGACAAVPSGARFVRRLQQGFVRRLWEAWPDLAWKLACLNGGQFERLYGEVEERRRRGA